MQRLFNFFKKKEITKKSRESLVNENVSLPSGSLSFVKNASEINIIPEEKLFISNSGYAYNIDDIVLRIKTVKVNALDPNPGFTNGAKGILCDYKNKKSYDEFKKDEFFKQFDVERNVLFSVEDIQKLNQFPEIKKALIEACKGEDFYNQLLESAFFITDETLSKMETFAKRAILFDHPFLGSMEEQLGGQLNEPIINMLKHVNSWGNNELQNVELASFNCIEKIMRENMQSEYKRQNTIIKDLKIITQQKNNPSCAAGFYQEFSNLYGIITTFKRYGQAIGYRPDLEENEEEKEKTTPTISLRKSQES